MIKIQKKKFKKCNYYFIIYSKSISTFNIVIKILIRNSNYNVKIYNNKQKEIDRELLIKDLILLNLMIIKQVHKKHKLIKRNRN